MAVMEILGAHWQFVKDVAMARHEILAIFFENDELLDETRRALRNPAL
jgi:hypothetical protein